MNTQCDTCINIAFAACMMHDEYSIRCMYEYSMRSMLHALIRRADRPNGVSDPGSEGHISDLAIFLCAISFSL